MSPLESWPAAVLWDFDGTLVDSHDYWTAVWADMAARRNGSWSDADTLTLVGLDLLDAAVLIRDHLGVDEAPERLVEEMVSGVAARMREEVPWRPGARELLASVRAEGIRCALVTMSYRPLVEPMLAQLAPGTFAAVVTAEQVPHGKPHPAPYLWAAASIGVAPADCVAIEDSATGVASARSAGCRVVIVGHDGSPQPAPNEMTLSSFLGVEVEDLRAGLTV